MLNTVKNTKVLTFVSVLAFLSLAMPMSAQASEGVVELQTVQKNEILNAKKKTTLTANADTGAFDARPEAIIEGALMPESDIDGTEVIANAPTATQTLAIPPEIQALPVDKRLETQPYRTAVESVQTQADIQMQQERPVYQATPYTSLQKDISYSTTTTTVYMKDPTLLDLITEANALEKARKVMVIR